MLRTFLDTLSFYIAFLFLAGSLLPGTAHAAQDACVAGMSSPEACQFEVSTSTSAPDVTVSKGIRLDGGVSHVLFRVADLPPYFISNSGMSDIFIPQNTAPEFASFISAIAAKTLGSIQAAGAIEPATYTASPKNYTFCTLTPEETTASVPGVQTTPTTNAIVDGYAELDAGMLEQGTVPTTQVGPLTFTQTREDCSQDDEKNRACNTALYTNTQTLLFRMTSSGNGHYGWDTKTPTITDKLAVAVNAGAATEVTDCTGTQAPVLKGTCGSNDGADLASIPTTDLCAQGDATVVDTYTTDYGLKWGWTCNDVQGTAAGTENQRIATGQGCGACQDKAKQTIGACSVSCGGGSQTVTWYDGCGNVELQYNQACNTQACCTPSAYTSAGSCSAACGGGMQTITVYNSCGIAESSYNQLCNPQACYNAGTDVYTSMRPYGSLSQSGVYTYTGGSAAFVSVSGPGAPSLRVNGGGWTNNVTIWPGQTIQLQAYAAFADASTEVITVATGGGSLRWHLTTANATLVYATYWGSGPNNCTSGHGNQCSNYYSCASGHMISCRVGTSCYQAMTTPNPGECNCSDRYTWRVWTAAGSSGAWATETNRCGNTSSFTNPGFAPYPGTGTMTGYIGMLLL